MSITTPSNRRSLSTDQHAGGRRLRARNSATNETGPATSTSSPATRTRSQGRTVSGQQSTRARYSVRNAVQLSDDEEHAIRSRPTRSVVRASQRLRTLRPGASSDENQTEAGEKRESAGREQSPSALNGRKRSTRAISGIRASVKRIKRENTTEERSTIEDSDDSDEVQSTRRTTRRIRQISLQAHQRMEERDKSDEGAEELDSVSIRRKSSRRSVINDRSKVSTRASKQLVHPPSSRQDRSKKIAPKASLRGRPDARRSPEMVSSPDDEVSVRSNVSPSQSSVSQSSREASHSSSSVTDASTQLSDSDSDDVSQKRRSAYISAYATDSIKRQARASQR